jgi:hypothetical protein
MKKLITTASLFLGLVMASPSWALYISGTLTDVGGIDGFLASDTLANSGAATEKAWVDSVIGGNNSLTYFDSSTVGGPAYWSETTMSGVYAYQFNNSAEPEYYFLKLGVGNSGADNYYLFQNVDDMNYAVVNFGDIFSNSPLDFNFGRISHLAGYGGSGGTSVPEPSAAALMGLGLLMIGVISRRRKQQS